MRAWCLAPFLLATATLAWIAFKRPRAPVILPQAKSCLQTIRRDLAGAAVAVVITISPHSRSSGDRRSLTQLVSALSARLSVRALIDAKGGKCSELPQTLLNWLATSRAHCVQGPNQGARESHSILRFCLTFYDHLPSVVLFVQDDPSIPMLNKVGLLADVDAWAARFRLESDERRLQQHGTPQRPWAVRSPEACPCWVEDESTSSVVKKLTNDSAAYGHARSLHWWLRTFLALPTIPSTIPWPQHAEFAVTREAIRGRSRRFYAMNLALASLPSPPTTATPDPGPAPDGRECLAWRCHSFHLPDSVREAHMRKYGCNGSNTGPCVQTWRQRAAKWSNFGPYIVDLGPRSAKAVDQRPALHSNDVGGMFERLWFAMFDSTVAERLPQSPESLCFSEAALLEGVVRCGANCVHGISAPGCAFTDRLGLTRPPSDALTGHEVTRCLAAGCMDVEAHLNASAGGAAVSRRELARAINAVDAEGDEVEQGSWMEADSSHPVRLKSEDVCRTAGCRASGVQRAVWRSATCRGWTTGGAPTRLPDE